MHALGFTGTAAPSFVETAFNSLIPDINAIGAFINKQTGNKLSYLVNTLLAGSPGTISFRSLHVFAVKSTVEMALLWVTQHNICCSPSISKYLIDVTVTFVTTPDDLANHAIARDLKVVRVLRFWLPGVHLADMA